MLHYDPLISSHTMWICVCLAWFFIIIGMLRTAITKTPKPGWFTIGFVCVSPVLASMVRDIFTL
jgi:bacteriorhodopsin